MTASVAQPPRFAEMGMSYHANVTRLARENEDFRRVLFTGAKSQLVLMAIPPGGEIGEETHARVEQSLFLVDGEGKAILDGVESPVRAGDVVVVTSGTRHNIVNTSSQALKIYTIYAPPNHLDGRIHRTKADAGADAEDEAFGETIA